VGKKINSPSMSGGCEAATWKDIPLLGDSFG
jgi:hypothetical protein